MNEASDKFQGVVIPLVSPFHEDYSVDTGSLEILTRTLLSAGASPFILGTTGEALSVSVKKKKLIVDTVVKHISGRCVVYAGISGNCFDETVDCAKRYYDAGVSVAVAHVPCYYPPDDKMVLCYYEKLAGSIPLPLVIYNIPQTTRYSISTELADKLSHHLNITGIKDSERSEERLQRSLGLWKDRTDFSYFAGWAAKSVEALTGGADGIIPGTGNLCPDCYTALYRYVREGSPEKAMTLLHLAERISALYQKGRTLGDSISALKLLMSARGLCKPVVMPPLVRMEPDEEDHFINEALPELNAVLESLQHEL
jgi:4-hydroxy-tetrahydrodipicolinate synthase